MYAELVIKHYQNSVPNVVCIPVPRSLQRYVTAILILRNHRYPRHFLNGFYVIFKDDLADFSQTDGIATPLEKSISALIGPPECSGRSLRNWTTTPTISRQLPLSFAWHFLGWTRPPNPSTTPNTISKDLSLVLSIRPGLMHRAYTMLRCYRTQLVNNSSIVDGCEYFSTKYPAKWSLVDHEITLAWVHGGTGKAVGYIQYTSHSNSRGEVHTLITGLSVEENWRRRGFARALICAVISRVSCHELWVAVMEDNSAAASLYEQCGFVERKKQWDLFSKTTIS